MDPSILALLLSIVTNLATGPINVYDLPKNLINKFKGDPKPINHDLQKAIKIAYLQALIEIAQEFKAGRIQPFRLYLPTELDQKIKQWKTELEQVKNAKDETEISSPLQDTAEIEQLLLSHGKPIDDRLQELETRLISQALQGISDLPTDYQSQIQTNLFARIYAHFVEQLKINDRAYRAFELEYLPTINASLTEIGVGQEQVALTMTDMLSVVNRTDQNVQKIIDILNPKSLTLEDWQEICRQNLTEQKQLTTNPFTNANGVTPQLDEIYVPLAIVESKPPKLPSRNQQEEKEEEKLIPIAEECFFEEVLRQGKSQISQGRKIAIIGEPGSGKTTRLQKIADWILKQDLGLPIWISLADLTQPTVSQYIEEIWLKQTGKSLTIDELTQQKDRIWLLLDGLDEMTSRVEMRHVSAVLGGWVQGARVVVTCRVNVWEADKNAFSGFDVFRNLEFNPEQVTDYIRRWFAGMGDAATGESLEAALAQSENSRLKELIQNPLRLWMLCQIWQTGGGLPETQAGLYGQFVDWVYDWKADNEILDQREAIDTALARLALAAMEQKDEVSRLRLPENWVLQVLGSRPIFQAVMKLGWLNRVERFPEAICVFYHASFQEYFAALAVDDWDYFLPRNHVNFPVAGKEYRIFEPQWKQVILLWLGRRDVADEDKERFIEKLVNFDDGCNSILYRYHAFYVAVAGIDEFETCSLADAIVQQVVDFGFGFYNKEKQEWQTFDDPIRNDAIEAIYQSNHKGLIQKLSHILKNTKFPHDPQWYITGVLGKIDPGNKTAINILVSFIDTTQDEDTWIAIYRLGEIGMGNETAIRSLTEIIQTATDEEIRRVTALSLGKINPGNPTAISNLVDIVHTTKCKVSRWQAVNALGTIDPGNEIAIRTLYEMINDEDTVVAAARSLGHFDPRNEVAIRALTEIILSEQDENCQLRAAEGLLQIDPGNKTAARVLVDLIRTNKDETIQQLAASIIETDKSLIGNQIIIHALNNMLKSTENEIIQGLAASILVQIDSSNTIAISTFIKLIKNTKDILTMIRLAGGLAKVHSHSEIAIDTLLNILDNTNERSFLLVATLKNVLKNEGILRVIARLKACISGESYSDQIERFRNCHELLLHCAQNLPYPDFYRAWHGLTETQTFPLVQTLNLAQLPQFLQTQLTETNLHQTLQLLCIDGSKFDNRDNPAADIYLQLVKKHHCPKSTEGTPRTLTELKIYWQLLDWEKHPILIFYEEAKPQGFSQTFLDFLTRFDATICVITDSPHPTIPTFSPQDPHLIQTIINWLQRTILEA